MNFDNAICLGNNTYVDSREQRHTDPNVVAYFDFDNDYGFDMS
jgi:hypothetical protein